MNAIANKVAIVTGVTGQFGRGIAKELAARGWNVVGTGRRADRGATFEQEVHARGGHALFVESDVRNVPDCRRIVDTAVATYGRVDLLVNSAATLTYPPFIESHELIEDNWDQVFDTNLKGAFYCAASAIDTMLKQGFGNIVNISSAHALSYGPPQMAAYVASKAGLIALTKTMAVEYGERGIRMNAIILGGAEGDALYQVQDTKNKAEFGDSFVPVDYNERNYGAITGEALARTILFLASDDARHINGSAVTVDDGLSAGGFWKWVTAGMRSLAEAHGSS
jgi:NAD(P)-dependent dehydrogenase (short-subunit alcohol dehydrogenase family)